MENAEGLDKTVREFVEKTVEEWAEELHVPLWLLYAARVLHSWGYGKKLSREEFERAIAKTRLLEVE